MKQPLIITLICLSLLSSGCEDVDMMLAAEAGIDAIKAATLSEEKVRELAAQTAQFSDSQNTIAASQNNYSQRLNKLTHRHNQQGELVLDFKVYVAPEVNAFAMADGTIRIYSGLMDMMTDGELLFVIGHEVGHVAKDHLRKNYGSPMLPRRCVRGPPPSIMSLVSSPVLRSAVLQKDC